MKKGFLASVLAVSFVLSCFNAPVFAENTKEKNKANAKSIERYQKQLKKKKKGGMNLSAKFYGKKSTAGIAAAGMDYSAQSTSAVGGGAGENLSSDNYDKKNDEGKQELFRNPVNVIEQVIKSKDIKTGK